LAAYIALGVLIQRALPPAPERFPEASSAFLYATFSASEIAIACAVLGTLGGMFLWLLHRGLAKVSQRGGGRRLKGTSTLFFVVAWIGALAAVPLIPLETASYQALSDAGPIGRNYWGEIERDQWASLHHVELSCGSATVRGRRDVRPILSLHFDGRQTIGRVLTMKPVGMTQRDALGRLEDIRAREQAALIWSRSAQGNAFQRHEEDVVECVDSFVGQFPAEKRERMRAELLNATRDTLASYR
jgi:hypothetical protein